MVLGLNIERNDVKKMRLIAGEVHACVIYRYNDQRKHYTALVVT